MNVDRVAWLEMLLITLADARAVLVCFGVDDPALADLIDGALAEAQALKQRAILS